MHRDKLFKIIHDHDESGTRNTTEDFLAGITWLRTPGLADGRVQVMIVLAISILGVMMALLMKEVKPCIKINQFLPSYFLHILLGMLLGLLELVLRRLDLFSVDTKTIISIPAGLLTSLRIPVLLHASYNLYHHHFFSQIVYILLYSIVMRILFLALTSSLHMLLHNYFLSHDLTYLMTYSQMVAFTCVAAVVNPLTVYNVFKDRTPKNFYLLLGIHILGNGITVEVFKASFLIARLDADVKVPMESYLILAVRALINLVGSIMVGCIIGILTSLFTKLTRKEKGCEYYEPYITIAFMMLTYFVCELLKFSSMFGVFCCGIVQERYVFMNMASRSVMGVKYACEALSYQADLTGYVLVGYKFFGAIFVETTEAYWFSFAFQAIFIHYIVKTFLTIFITCMINLWKKSWGKNPISTRLQALIVFGGVKGARSFGLVATYKTAPFSKLFQEAITFMIVFSVVVDTLISKGIARSLRRQLEQRQDVIHIPVFPDQVEAKVDGWMEQLRAIEATFYGFLVDEDYEHKDEVREKRDHDRQDALERIDDMVSSPNEELKK